MAGRREAFGVMNGGLAGVDHPTKASGVMVGGLLREGNAGPAPGREGHNLDHFCLRLAPFNEAAIRAHLAAHDIEAGETQRRYGAEGYGPSIYLQGPEGNTVELKGPPDD